MKRLYRFIAFSVGLEAAAILLAIFGVVFFEHFYQLFIAAGIATWLTEAQR